MKISLVIPCYTINKDLEKLAIRAALSYREQVDELIVTEDAGFYSPELMKLSDIYIWNKKNIGFTANVNLGWKMAHGQYVCITNSDTVLMSGFLVDMCKRGHITSPNIINQYIDFLAGPFWCAPKEVTLKYGYLMEEMKTYSSDSEYDNRVRGIFEKVETVKIYHEQAKTVKAAGIEGGKEQQRDREIYQRLKEEGKAK